MVPLPFVQYPQNKSQSLNFFLSVQLCVKEAARCSVCLTFDAFLAFETQSTALTQSCKYPQSPIPPLVQEGPTSHLVLTPLPYVPDEQCPCPFSKAESIQCYGYAVSFATMSVSANQSYGGFTPHHQEMRCGIQAVKSSQFLVLTHISMINILKSKEKHLQMCYTPSCLLNVKIIYQHIFPGQTQKGRKWMLSPSCLGTETPIFPFLMEATNSGIARAQTKGPVTVCGQVLWDNMLGHHTTPHF